MPITTSAFDGEMDTELDDDLLDQVDEVFNDTNDDINIKQSSNDNALELNSLFYPYDSLYFQNTNQNFPQSDSTGTNYLEILERHSCFAEDTYTYNQHNNECSYEEADSQGLSISNSLCNAHDVFYGNEWTQNGALRFVHDDFVETNPNIHGTGLLECTTTELSSNEVCRSHTHESEINALFVVT